MTAAVSPTSVGQRSMVFAKESNETVLKKNKNLTLTATSPNLNHDVMIEGKAAMIKTTTSLEA